MTIETAMCGTGPVPTLAPLLKSNHLFGHLAEMRRDPIGLIMGARAEMGDVVRVRIGHEHVLFVYHPNDIRHVLVDESRRYRKETPGYGVLKLLLGEGLLTSEGAHWKRQRRISQPAFHRKVIAGFFNTFLEQGQRMVLELSPHADSGAPVDMVAVLNKLTLRVAARTLFGTDVDEEQVGESLTVVLERFSALAVLPIPGGHLFPSPKNIRFRRAISDLHQVVDQIIAARRDQDEMREDLLGLLMASVDDETGEGMTDRELRDEIMTMLLAGHETTANALCWTLMLLSKHPETARRLEAELDGGFEPAMESMEGLRKLTYTSQVVSESMRLYPPAWILGRKAVVDDVIGGFDVPAGTSVYMCQYATHRHPDFWDNPEGFDPDRFAVDGDGASRFSKQAYFPFSMGQRKCIGDHFARMESVVLLAVLCRAYGFSLLPGHQVQADPSVTLRPAHSLPMTLSRRLSSQACGSIAS